ncbi:MULTISPECIES: cobalt transporter CbiM [unclassified Ruegeria]|uniref:cobalt transporter CbiM n=1 Tax=unclassified Ruegeria TaxID=2625375 RepID=UPI001489FEF7|nr:MULTISPECIES: cobalt transporter CbiM [unclassified Ruegeria]NOD36264.1 cobalt transporter CbiM [Ruegeria sp. HKCCD7296]NOD47330.1 cobalt transporter CbiM [Ruegeria sp. HKCCD5849]NOD53277.1 cobalt transporter CbiM [Ruegeria sp. HKCCD5851]NOD66470.1 cobalt transporter CbiM [Ruegeria sp. HKCCD7303]NOE43657.1 cobalt transporter CbiM [Ruegeria sp. HKCCD7319]
MHIVDGALSNPVVIGGAIAAAGGIAMGLKSLDLDRIPTAGVLSASFFVASLIHVPIGPSSVHLILNGLAGLLLGWAAFPALFVGLLLQAVFFGFGGLTVLGINTVNIALPAVLTWIIFGRLIAKGTPVQGAVWGGIGGAFSIAATTAFVAVSLALSGDEFLPAAKLVLFAHVPVMAVEAVLTGFAILLARQVKPELFYKGASA